MLWVCLSSYSAPSTDSTTQLLLNPLSNHRWGYVAKVDHVGRQNSGNLFWYEGDHITTAHAARRTGCSKLQTQTHIQKDTYCVIFSSFFVTIHRQSPQQSLSDSRCVSSWNYIFKDTNFGAWIQRRLCQYPLLNLFGRNMVCHNSLCHLVHFQLI